MVARGARDVDQGSSECLHMNTTRILDIAKGEMYRVLTFQIFGWLGRPLKLDFLLLGGQRHVFQRVLRLIRLETK